MINYLFLRIQLIALLTIAINFGVVNFASACNSKPCFCIQIDEAGVVTLVWDQANFPIYDFYEHQFFADTGNGFQYIGAETDSSVMSFTFSNYYAANNSSTYYIKTFYGPNATLVNYSDTLTSIYFDLVNQFDGNVHLSWNHPFIVDSIPANAVYQIEKSTPVNPPTSAVWSTVTTLPKDSLTYVDNISVCAAWFNYRVKLITDNCSFISNIDGGYIQDQQAPDPPVIQYVTNDTLNDELIVHWSPSNAQDVSAYIVFKSVSGIWTPIDTIYGNLNTTFIDNDFTSFQSSVVQYAIAAMDSCSFGNPPQNNTSSAGSPHQNILLQDFYDQCSGEVILTWNSYINFAPGLSHYEIYYKNDITPWTLLDTTSNNNYVLDIQQGNMNYSFIINAVADTVSLNAISNTVDFYANQPPVPQVSYVSSVSVFEDTVRIKYVGQNNIGIQQVNFYRSVDNGISYDKIHTSLNPIFPLLYDDLNLDTDRQSYMYQVSVIDSCSNEVAFSNIGASILLRSESVDFLSNKIKWNAYSKWEQGVASYNVLMSNNINSSFLSLSVLDSNEFNYLHEIESYVIDPFDGQVCYKILASENYNSYGTSDESYSNEICVEQDPLVFIPNALIIGGVNNQWKPIMNLYDFNSYKVSIYNRLGQLVKELDSQNDYWDGTVLSTSQLAPMGVYVFWMEFKNSNGQFFNRKGHINLIR